MLSKVLKGAAAGQLQAMAFTPALAPVGAMRQSSSSSQPAATEDQAALVEKIRNLESRIAVVQREAFDAGHAQGEQEARAAVAPVLARMNASIAEVINLRPELRRRAEKDAVELSLKIARRVLHRELAIDKNALNALARVVFDRLGRSETWKLTVHPQFADAIRGSLPSGSTERVRIEADLSCSPGTLVVRCEDGTIDGSIDSQLDEISCGLTDRLIQ